MLSPDPLSFLHAIRLSRLMMIAFHLLMAIIHPGWCLPIWFVSVSKWWILTRYSSWDLPKAVKGKDYLQSYRCTPVYKSLFRICLLLQHNIAAYNIVSSCSDMICYYTQGVVCCLARYSQSCMNKHRIFYWLNFVFF